MDYVPEFPKVSRGSDDEQWNVFFRLLLVLEGLSGLGFLMAFVNRSSFSIFP
mgnify:CR=1 FL=1